MADQFDRFLEGFGQGILNPKGNLGDARHAARLFTDYSMSRAPRTKFSYHIFFDIEKEAMRGSDWKFKHQLEAGMLVKSADLPKMTYDYDFKNQYNKKKIIYKDIKYDPISISLHDDNAGIVNAMMALYYGYYSPERFIGTIDSLNVGYHSNGSTGVGAGMYDSHLGEELKAQRYGLDSDGTNMPFFNSITIYTMAKKTFNSYTLIKPHIVSMSHGQVNSSESNGTGEITMQLAYESVRYGTGRVIKGKEPKGFQLVHYDKVPSPLTISGGAGQGQLFGPLGILADAGAEVIFDASIIFRGFYVDDAGSPGDLLSSAIRAVNLYKSLASISPESLAADAQNILQGSVALPNSTSGLPGVSFPGVR